MDMKILVTGAGGYLGRGIVTKLLDDSVAVVATDYDTSQCDARAIRISCDLFEAEDPFEFFGKPDAVLHLAWKDGFMHNADSHMDLIPLHHRFLRKMFQSDVKKVAVMGTMHEVGFYEGSIDEDSPCHPMSLYGIAKNAVRNDCEWLAKQTGRQLQWLRGFYIVGNVPFGSSIFSKISKASLDGKDRFPFTMGLNQFDFLDYEEFCAYVAATVEQDAVDGIINICSGRPEKLADRVERFIKENGFDIQLEYGAFPDRPYDSKAVWGNDEKVRKAIEEYKKVRAGEAE